MAVSPDRDSWLAVLVDMVLVVHGMCWMEDRPLREGDRPRRRGLYQASRKAGDRRLHGQGGAQGVQEQRRRPWDDRPQELDLLRWHGGKATLTTLMQHLELDPKMIRLAGDWFAKEDTMPDTYLREAQLMVLRGQESCMPLPEIRWRFWWFGF